MTTEIAYRLKDMLSSVPDCQCETCLHNRATLAELDAQGAELIALRAANTAQNEAILALDQQNTAQADELRLLRVIATKALRECPLFAEPGKHLAEWKAKYGKQGSN